MVDEPVDPSVWGTSAASRLTGPPGAPPVLGDPESMKLLARSFSNSAEEIATRSIELQRRYERLGFEGPAAQRLLERLTERRREAEKLAGELVEAANTLLRSAAQVEDDIALLERRQARLQEL